MLTANAESNIWPLVNVYIAHLQMTVLGLRVEIASKIQDTYKNDDDNRRHRHPQSD